MYSNGPPHTAEQKQEDQLEHTYSSYVGIWDVALKPCRRRWTIRRSGERGPRISGQAARHDNDDIYIYIYIYIYNLYISLYDNSRALSSLFEYINTDILLRHCNAVYNQNLIDRWMKGCILPFPKKGELRLAKNYRGITLTSIAAKIYNALLRNRIEPKIDNILRKN